RSMARSGSTSPMFPIAAASGDAGFDRGENRLPVSEWSGRDTPHRDRSGLLRILRTLEGLHLVSRRLGDGRYRVSANLTRVARRRTRYDRVAEAAAPVLDKLCQKISWPSDLLVPAGDCMEIAETSQTRSPFLIQVSGIGSRVNWLLSAVGRAY